MVLDTSDLRPDINLAARWSQMRAFKHGTRAFPTSQPTCPLQAAQPSGPVQAL